MNQNIYVKDKDKHLWNKLKEMAEKKDRSISYLAHEAIEEYIAKEEKREN